MSNLLVTDYTFDPINKKITLPNIESVIPGFILGNIKIITNLTNGEIIYIPQISGKSASWNGLDLQLLFDTSSMSQYDELQIIVVDENLLNRQLRAAPLPISIQSSVPLEIQDVGVSTPSTAWNKIFNYAVFDSVNNKIKFPIWLLGYPKLSQSQIVKITNTTKNIVLYYPSVVGLGGNLVEESGVKTLILELDTSSMDDTDVLQVILAIPPVNQFASNKSINILHEHIDFNKAIQIFNVEPEIEVESQLDSSSQLQLNVGEKCLQVVKLSSDSINNILLSVFGVPIPNVTIMIDDFNSYLSSNDLLTTWVQNSNQLDVQLGDSTNSYEGVGSLSFIIKSQSLNKTITRTYSSDQNWADKSAVYFKHKSSLISAGVSFKIRIKDVNNNWAYRILKGAESTTWKEHILPLSDFIPEISALDFSKIRVIQFIPVTRGSTVREYIDLIELNGWDEVDPEIGISIYDFGSVAPNLLSSLPSPIVLRNEVDKLNFIVDHNPSIVNAKILLNNLTKNNYYGFLITNESLFHNIIVLASSTRKYISGGTYLVHNEVIDVLTDNSLQFSIVAPIPSFYNNITVTFNDEVGEDSILRILLIDSQGKLVHAVANLALGST